MRLSDPESADMILANVTEQLTAAGAGQLSAGAKILSGEEVNNTVSGFDKTVSCVRRLRQAG